MSHLLKNLILNLLVSHKAEGAAEVPSKWVWVTRRASQGCFVGCYNAAQVFKAKPHGAYLRSQIELILFSPALADDWDSIQVVAGNTVLYKLQMQTVFPKPAAWHPVVKQQWSLSKMRLQACGQLPRQRSCWQVLSVVALSSWLCRQTKLYSETYLAAHRVGVAKSR